MSDASTNEGTGNGAAQPPAQPKMNVLAQYIRDMSFENVLAQKGATGETQPDIQVQVNLDARKRQTENQYEVLMKLNITNKSKATGDTLFLLELDYAGVFQVENVPDDQLAPVSFDRMPAHAFSLSRAGSSRT